MLIGSGIGSGEPIYLIKSKRTFNGGWRAESIGTPLAPAVIVGDRAIPTRIDLSHPGADGQPAITLELEFRDDIAQCRALHLEAVEDGRPIRPLDLDAIQKRLFEWIDNVFAAFAWRVEPTSENTVAVFEIEPSTAESFEAALTSVTRIRRPRKIDRTFLQRVAEMYRDNFEGNPTQAIANELGVAHRTAASYVQQTREMKLLGPPSKGRKSL